MKTTFVSTASLTNAPRAAAARIRSELTVSAKEAATGRFADIGLALGSRTGESVSLRRQDGALQAMIDGNGLISGRLDQSQTTLGAMSQGANDFLSALVSVVDANNGPALIESRAGEAMTALIDHLNTSDGTRFSFGGVNSGVQPMADFAGAPKAAIDTAFAQAFGLRIPDPQHDPKVGAIAPAAMADFLDNQFAALFADPAWGATWSSASDQNIASRISQSERIETSANANEPAMRKLAMVYSMVSELGTAKLGQASFHVVIDKARSLAGSAVSELTAVQARLGVAQHRVNAVNDRLVLQQNTVQRGLSALEEVDPAEAKTRIDTLSNQLEMSYALTAKFMKLSILNYA